MNGPFFDNLAQYDDAPALMVAGDAGCLAEVISYRELVRRADAFAAEQGWLDARRRLLLLECRLNVATIVALLAALRHRMPLMLIDAELPLARRAAIVERYQVECVIQSEPGQALPEVQVFSPVHDDLPDRRDVVLHPDLALLLSTSGSTGSPKCVRLSAANLHHNACSIAEYLHLDAQQRPISSLPLHYSYGLSVLNSHWAVGACLALTSESMSTRGFWEFFRTAAATSFAGVPTHYAMLRQFRFERMPLPSLQMMTQAGGRLSVELQQWLGELALSRGLQFYVMYGQTEATARMAYLPPDQVLTALGSIGQAIPGGELSLCDDQGQVLIDPKVVGELCYRGSNVMMGYADGAGDLGQGDICQGFLRTGDLARRDEHGFFTITGRLNRMIKVFGLRIALDELEQQLRSEGFDVAVTGQDDALWVAFQSTHAAVPDDDALSALKQQWATRLGIHASGLSIGAVPVFPRSSQGKILYADLLQMLIVPPSPAAPTAAPSLVTTS